MTQIGKFMLAGVAAAVLTLAAAPATQAKTMGPTAAAIVGGVAGVAVGAAIADAAKPKKKKIVYEGYAPPYAPGQYDPYFNQAYSPVAGVVCYPAQRACYNNGGTVNGTWTRRAFGY